MKKLALILCVAAIALFSAAPAFAVSSDMVDFEGSYRVRAFMNTHTLLLEETDGAPDATNSFYDSRFRLQTRFRPTDFLSATLRFDALESLWGGLPASGTAVGDARNTLIGVPATPNLSNNVEFEHAYLTATTSVGKFDLGRMSALAWGTSFADNETELDRIKYTIKYGNLIGIAIIQKDAELDGVDFRYTDGDQDTYYLAGIYKMENLTAGLLGAFTNGKAASDNPQAATNAPIAGPFDRQTYALLPFVQGTTGPVRYQGELVYQFGEAREFDRDLYAVPAVVQDVDQDNLAYNLEVGYDVNPFSFEAGYAYMSGDGLNAAGADSDPTKNENAGGAGKDWGKLWILTSTDQYLQNTLGGMGNLGNPNSAVSRQGAKILYLGAGVTPMEDVSLKLLFGTSDAEDPDANVSQDHGEEYDLFVNYQIYDNLGFQFIAAYLDAGDFWQQGNNTVKIENATAVFSKLELKF